MYWCCCEQALVPRGISRRHAALKRFWHVCFNMRCFDMRCFNMRCFKHVLKPTGNPPPPFAAAHLETVENLCKSAQTDTLGMSLRVGIQVSDRCRPESGLRKIVPIHSESVQNITKLRSVSASRPRRTPHLANSVFHVLKKPDSERPRKEEAGQHQGVTLQALAQTHKTPFKHAQHFGRRTP